MKLTGAGFLLLLALTNSATANACTLADAQNSFSQLNRVFLSYNGAIFAEKENQPKTSTPANAQAAPETVTQTNAQDETKTRADGAEPGAEAVQPQPPADKLSGLLEKRADIIAQTATIRKIFAEEVQNNPDMKAQDALNPVICEKFAAVAKNHNVIINFAPAKEERAVCTKKDLSPRFIAATRMQRKLTLAGKVNGKERVSYLKMVIKFKKNSRRDFDEACNTLHEYEKRLKAEKGNE